MASTVLQENKRAKREDMDCGGDVLLSFMQDMRKQQLELLQSSQKLLHGQDELRAAQQQQSVRLGAVETTLSGLDNRITALETRGLQAVEADLRRMTAECVREQVPDLGRATGPAPASQARGSSDYVPNARLTCVQGFPRDSSRTQLDSWFRGLSILGSMPAPQKIWAPFLRGSEIRAEWSSVQQAQDFISAFRQSPVLLSVNGTSYTLRCSGDKTPEARTRNRALYSAASTLLADLRPEEPERHQEWHQAICWRTGKIWICGAHVVTWHRQAAELRWEAANLWWTARRFVSTADAIKARVQADI